MSSFGAKTSGEEIVKQFADQVAGKTIVITGASEKGIGAQTAINLAHGNPAQIVLLARSKGKVQPVIDQIKSISPSTNGSFVPVELDKVASIRSAAEQVNNQISKLDILINNAGIMAVAYAKTELGIESQLATNHLGHFLLTKLLMPKILAVGKGARIINVSSDGHAICPMRFDDPNFEDGAKYAPFAGYGQAKTANILFSVALASKLAKKGILSYSLHPGIITTTGLADNLAAPLDFEQINKLAIEHTGKPFSEGSGSTMKTPDEGSSTTIRAALDPSLASHSGSYLQDAQIHRPRDYASSPENAEELWQWSEKILGEKFEV